MPKRVDFHSGARRDFDESFDWYAERSAGAAIGFASAVDDAIEKISADPERFPAIGSDCRYCSLIRYPFRLVFRVEDNRLVIVAVAHAKRQMGYWRSRR